MKERKRQTCCFPQAAYCFLCIVIFAVLSLSATPASAQHPTQRPYIINNKQYYPIPDARGFRQQGIASWYGRQFHGRHTSNGEFYNMHSMTAAHKTLPMNTMVLVRSLDTGKKTVVRINDRGPFVRGRVIDLSYQAARRIGMVNKGIANVQIIALAEKRISGQNGRARLVYRDPNIGEFYVQIGAFRQQINAITLQKLFINSRHTTVIQTGLDNEKKTIYRVQVYVGGTLKEAKAAEKAILKRGWNGSFVIAR